MADPIDRPQPNHCLSNDRKSLKYAFDAGFVTGAHPSDTPDADDGDSASRWSSDSESFDSDGESNGLADLAASFRVVSDSLLRMEQAELEMVKAREASRLAAEKRRSEVETELTQMLLNTQLQIASSVSRTSSSRKRKRSDQVDDLSNSSRERAMLLILLQCNLI